MPADFLAQIGTLASHLHGLNLYALGLGLLCVVGLFVWPRLWAVDSRFRRQRAQGDAVTAVGALKVTARLPAPVVALLTLSLLTWFLQTPKETIGTRFDGIAQTVPAFALPDVSWETVKLPVTPTLTIAIPGAIGS
jgi:SulP family sulfate permease